MFKAILLTVVLLVPNAVWAQEEETTRLTSEVLWQLDRVGAPLISPNGKRVVVPVTSYAQDSDESETRLWLLDAGNQSPQRPLTLKGAKASEPVFSADGSRLAFVSKRDDDEAGQIYVLPMTGPGEAVRITEVPTGVYGLRWEGEHLYFISSVWPGLDWEAMAERITEEEEDHVSAYVWDKMPYSHFDHYLDQARENHVYRIPAAGGDIEAITEPLGLALLKNSTDSTQYDVSPDGRHLVFVADSRAGGVYPNHDVYLVKLGESEAKNLTPDNSAADHTPQFSPDGKHIAFARQRIEGFYGDQQKLMLFDVSSGDIEMLHEDWDYSATGLVWAPDSKGMYGSIGDRATNRVFYIPVGRGEPKAITGATDFRALSVANDGTLVASNQSFLYPARVGLVNTRNGNFSRLDSFNDDVLANVDMGTYESVTYTGADGAEIQMWVNYPPGFDSRREYPLLMLIHGGPHGAISDSFHYRWNAQAFASWGYVAVWPNFHGSSSFGQDFVDSINPDWITKPYADVMAAAGYMMEKPYIDEERTVAGGGSYGGYLSSIILGKEHPFNALVIHAAVYDLYAQMSADFAVNMQRFGPYWENPDHYREQSPHYYAANFNTPSLVIHGQNDLRVPVGQGFELFRTLQTRGVDSRLVYYPDENHWVLKRGNSIHWYGEFQNWVEKYAEPGPQ